MSSKRLIWVYGLLGMLALVVTWYYNILFLQQNHEGYAYVNFFFAGVANYAATSLTIDLTITLLMLFVWIYVEAKREDIPYWWVYCLIGVFVAVAVAWAAFLIVREKKKLN